MGGGASSRNQVAHPPRPVSAASLLLVLAAAAIAFDSAVGLYYARPVTEAFQHAYAGVAGASFSILSIRAAGTILLLVAGGLVVLAYFNQRGSATARINTWILGALLLCWGGSSLFSSGSALPPDAPDPVELERLLAAAVPGWVDPVTTVSIACSVSAVLAAMVLLALPPARRHFAPADEPA